MSPGSKNSPATEEQRRLQARESNLWLRAGIIQAIRRFFIERGYLEIETPHLIPAPAPELHIDAIKADNSFLHTSPELCMKRLLSAGYSRIFQICRAYRDGERGGRHLPEFTLLEWYRAGSDYLALMDECEEMILFVAGHQGFGERLPYQGREIDLRGPWDRIPVKEAFVRHGSQSMEEALASGRFDEIMAVEIEPHLGVPSPAFLYDYPASLASLARLKKKEPELAERFELYVGGLELANAFSELIDRAEQEMRFKEDREKRLKLGKAVYPLPARFLEAIGHMPASAGIALGVDRLVMLFADRSRIEDVVSFAPEEV